MKITFRLDDELYRQAKARAAALGISLTRFLEDAVREQLLAAAPAPRRRRVRLPVSTASGGLAGRVPDPRPNCGRRRSRGRPAPHRWLSRRPWMNPRATQGTPDESG
jgi:hypothetical protein